MATASAIKTTVERAVKAMQDRPAIAEATIRNSAHLDDGLGCACTEGDWRLDLDLPKSIGGEHNGPTPGVYVRSALTACIAMGIKLFACRYDVPVEAVDVDLTVEADFRADFGIGDVPPGYKSFAVEISVTSSADPAIVEKLVADSLACSPLLALHVSPQTVDVNVTVTPATAEIAVSENG